MQQRDWGGDDDNRFNRKLRVMTSKNKNIELQKKIEATKRLDKDAEFLFNKIDNIFSEYIKKTDGKWENGENGENDILEMLIKNNSGEMQTISIHPLPLTLLLSISAILNKLTILIKCDRSNLFEILSSLILDDEKIQEKISENDPPQLH